MGGGIQHTSPPCILCPPFMQAECKEPSTRGENPGGRHGARRQHGQSRPTTGSLPWPHLGSAQKRRWVNFASLPISEGSTKLFRLSIFIYPVCNKILPSLKRMVGNINRSEGDIHAPPQLRKEMSRGYVFSMRTAGSNTKPSPVHPRSGNASWSPS